MGVVRDIGLMIRFNHSNLANVYSGDIKPAFIEVDCLLLKWASVSQKSKCDVIFFFWSNVLLLFLQEISLQDQILL